MANQKIDLSGVWQSRYEYGESQQGEHIVDLRQHALKVNGSSHLDDTGSELFLDLWLRPPKPELGRGGWLLDGFWKEETSPSGTYRGQLFQGVLQLILNDEANKAQGKWAGHDRGHSQVNTGNWFLTREK